MAKEITMVFSRDKYQKAGCLEYSWVPEGIRRHIELRPGQQDGKNDDPYGVDVGPTVVQVYVATNNEAVNTEMWQFPPVAVGTSPISSARIEISEELGFILGTVTYADGTTSSPYSTELQPRPAQCPTGR